MRKKRNKEDLFYEILGIRIQIFRESKKWNQGVLAKKVGLSRTSIANIESGRQRVLAHQLRDFAQALNTTVLKLTKGCV